MNKRAILTIGILVVVAIASIGAAWYLGLGGPGELGLTPAGSFSIVSIENNRTFNLTFEKLAESGSANYEDCRLMITDPQSTQYNWDLTGIAWANNEANHDSIIPGIDLMVIRSNGQTTFSTGNLIELAKHSGNLAAGNWEITLIYRRTGGTLASRIIVV